MESNDHYQTAIPLCLKQINDRIANVWTLLESTFGHACITLLGLSIECEKVVFEATDRCVKKEVWQFIVLCGCGKVLTGKLDTPSRVVERLTSHLNDSTHEEWVGFWTV